MGSEKNKLVAILNCHDDDVYCFRKEVIEKILADGHTVLICCPYGEKLELMNDLDFIFQDTPIDRRGTNPINDFKLLVNYLNIFRKYKPDVVLTYTAKPNIYGSMAARILGISYINNVTGLGSVLKKKLFLKKFIFYLFKVAFKQSKCVFFQNHENLDLAISEHLITGKYRVIPGSGVNTTRFDLKEYPAAEEKIIFNYIGRVLREKGVDDYIEVAKNIKQQNKNIEFNIIGFIEPTEIQYKDLLDQLESDDVIRYRGSQKDVRPFIERSHCTIHPSVYGEGMSNALLESAAVGRPVITTNISGCKEIVDNGVNGFVYEAGNRDELQLKVECFLELSNSEREKMGLAGRKKVESEFNRNIVVDAYCQEISLL